MLNRNTGELLDLVRNKSDETLNHRSFNSWSILQVLEHLLITERYVLQLLTTPTEKVAPSKVLRGEENLNRILVDLRGRKVKAPDMLEPSGEINDIREFSTAFLKSRATLGQSLENGNITVDERVHAHPVLGDMTVSDWLHFLISHARRHMEQIRDILRALEK